ncbi:alpha/beta fold hydrolase [Ponticaulis sp.]|uniref:alpha/beta hydrolase n=1 Tax=Ponticaulis sp. TaxID=2020902 RepID=UPI00262113C5|nr:alpha/beta fold hydrolase [Ponticaulis sp.]MDF1679367.1 alpha/beta fold hydrolase [Ponticaulis sp.]
MKFRRTPLSRFFPVVLAALSLSACISGPNNRLMVRPVPDEEARESASVLVVSTRARSDEPGVVYSGERSPRGEISIINIAAPPDHQTGRLELPHDGSRLDANEHFVTNSIDYIGENPTERVVSWFEQQVEDGSVLIFVHGYNVTFDAAVFGLAQMKLDSGMRQAPVLFAWPSSGRLNGYLYDRESANYSRDDLENLITGIANREEVRDITIFAHSMGSWLTMEALRQYSIRNGGLNDKITNVVLASPDLDVDVFWRQMETLGPDRPPFTILVTQDDRALWFSRLIAGASRLGGTDPTSPEVLERLQEAGGITVLDLTDVPGGDRMRHSSFLTAPDIVGHLGSAILNENALVRNYDATRGIVLDVGHLLTAPLRIGDEVDPLVFVPRDMPEDNQAPGAFPRFRPAYAVEDGEVIEVMVEEPASEAGAEDGSKDEADAGAEADAEAPEPVQPVPAQND